MRDAHVEPQQPDAVRSGSPNRFFIPLSREGGRLEFLKRGLAIYRFVLGQSRQQELVQVLQNSDISRGELDARVMKLGVE